MCGGRSPSDDFPTTPPAHGGRPMRIGCWSETAAAGRRKSDPMRELTNGRARVRIFPDRTTWGDGAAQFIRETLLTAIEARGAAFIAISGGATPAPVYERLGRSPEGSDPR